MVGAEQGMRQPAHEPAAGIAGVGQRGRRGQRAEHHCEKSDYTRPHVVHYSGHKSLQHPRSEMPVTITAVDTIQLSIPLDTWAPPPMFAGKPRTHVEAVYVRVTTSSGVVGWGESFGSSGSLVGAAFDKWIRVLAVG